MLMKEIRIYLEKGHSDLSWPQKQNLFWLKGGYLFYFEGLLKSEKVARSLAFLQLQLPVKTVVADNGGVERFEGLEEAFYVSALGEVISVYQIGKYPVGRSRLVAKAVREFQD